MAGARYFVATRATELACAAVFLALAAIATDIRMDGPWSDGALLALSGGAFAAIYVTGLLSPATPDGPTAQTSAMVVAALVLALPALVRLAEVLGVESPLIETGTLTWMFGVLAMLAVVPAIARASAAATLICAIGVAGVVLAGVDWMFEPSGGTTFRYLIAGLALAFFAAGLAIEGRRPRHGVVLVGASGLAAVLLGILVTSPFPLEALDFENPPWGWQTTQLVAGLALLVYAALRREPGPAYLGVLVLVLFAFGAGVTLEPEPNLLGWPLGLFIAATLLVAAALRPRGGPAGRAPDAGVPAVPPAPQPVRAGGASVDPRDPDAT